MDETGLVVTISRPQARHLQNTLSGESFVLPDRYELRMFTVLWVNWAETRPSPRKVSHNDPVPAQLKAFLIASALSSRFDGAHFGGIFATSRIPAFSNFSKSLAVM